MALGDKPPHRPVPPTRAVRFVVHPGIHGVTWTLVARTSSRGTHRDHLVARGQVAYANLQPGVDGIHAALVACVRDLTGAPGLRPGPEVPGAPLGATGGPDQPLPGL